MRLKNKESESAFLPKLTITNAAIKTSSKVGVLVKSQNFFLHFCDTNKIKGHILKNCNVQSLSLTFSKNVMKLSCFARLKKYIKAS